MVHSPAAPNTMSTILQDLRFGARMLARTPGYTFIMILTLGLGIGAATSLFSVVHGVLLKPLPYGEGEELFRLRHEAPLVDVDEAGVSVAELSDYRAHNHTMTDLVEYHALWFTMLDQGEPQRVQSGVVSWNFFQVLEVEPVLGRLFTPEEDRVGAPPVLLLGHRFWQEHFGGDPGVIGRAVEMNDQVYTIVGILPPLPRYPDDNDVWMPWYACPFRSGSGWTDNRGVRALTVLGRLREGVRLAGARADVHRITGAMAREYPDAYPERLGFRSELLPLEEELTREARPTLLILLAMSALVLIIACANVANLALARVARRDQEFSVRTALGAARPRLARQLLTESVLLAVLGGIMGILLAFALTDVLTAFSARLTPRADEIGVDLRVLGVALALSLGTGLLVGCGPALLAGKDVAASLREGHGQSGGRGHVRLRHLLIGSQLAIAFVLLAGAGLMVRTLVSLQRVDAGFDARNVLTAQLDLDWSVHTAPERQREIFREVLERVRELPGVVAAAVGNTFPLNGGTFTGGVTIEDNPLESGEVPPQIDGAVVSTGYFDALRIPLISGREFTDSDHADAVPIAVVNRSFARRFWSGQDPIGRRFSTNNGQIWRTVVGVVGDVKQDGLTADFREQYYLPLAQTGLLSGRLVVRTRGAPTSLSRAIVDAAHAVDPRQPVAFIQSMEDVRRESVAAPRLTALLLGLFAAFALTISVAGILGVVSFSVAQRTREIGVRLALGARRSGLIWLVVRQAVTVAAIGLAVGIAGALALSRFLGGLLYGVPPADPLTFTAVAALLSAAVVAAAALPAQRATGIAPRTALRGD